MDIYGDSIVEEVIIYPTLLSNEHEHHIPKEVKDAFDAALKGRNLDRQYVYQH